MIVNINMERVKNQHADCQYWRAVKLNESFTFSLQRIRQGEHVLHPKST